MRFSIATLFLFVLIVAIYFPVSTLFSKWQSNRITSQFPHFSLLLQLSKLREGDSFDLVERSFPTELSFIPADSGLRSQIEQFAATTETEVNSETDFYCFNYLGTDSVLMFEQGKLVNHSYPNFDNPVAAARKSGVRVPSVWFRLGILPYYLAASGAIIAGWISLRIFRQAR